jgi:hypothetical protein
MNNLQSLKPYIASLSTDYEGGGKLITDRISIYF